MIHGITVSCICCEMTETYDTDYEYMTKAHNRYSRSKIQDRDLPRIKTMMMCDDCFMKVTEIWNTVANTLFSKKFEDIKKEIKEKNLESKSI